MRIGIEAQRIFRPHKHGMDRVAIELIKALKAIDKSNEYFVFVKDDLDNAVLENGDNFSIVKTSASPYPYWEQVQLPRLVKKYNLDLLHCTNNTAPIRIHIPLIVTIHDIIYLEQLNLTRGTPYQIFGNLYRRWNVSAIADKATQIITVSDYERKNMLNYFKFDKHRITTIYNGVTEAFFEGNNQLVRQSVKKAYNLPDHYILYLGNPDPRKNLRGVILALMELKKHNRLSFFCVFLGIKRDNVVELCDELGDISIAERIVFPGYVPDEDLPGIYGLATLFLYPSLREGFGMPIIEAMAAGTPVVTSDTSSMPEVAGNAAILVDPHDPKSIALGVDRLYTDKILQNDLISRGIIQAKQFSWKNNAIKTLEVYQESCR